jgi:hypothetical protein
VLLTTASRSHNVGGNNALAIYPERNMMKIITTTTFAALMLVSLSAQAEQPIINLSVGGEISPGVYGQVQFGNAPPPLVLYAQPITIEQQPEDEEFEPIYLHVPPGHAKHWAKHCREYDACDQPVYFVISQEYEPGYRKHKDRGHREESRRDEHREDEDHHGGEGDRGRGHDKGRDHDD